MAETAQQRPPIFLYTDGASSGNPGPGGYGVVLKCAGRELELSGGWGGNTFVATAGVSFNNFSTRRILDKSSWRPVPLGDAQTLSFRFQTNGTYYTSLSASFSEPWPRSVLSSLLVSQWGRVIRVQLDK